MQRIQLKRSKLQSLYASRIYNTSDIMSKQTYVCRQIRYNSLTLIAQICYSRIAEQAAAPRMADQWKKAIVSAWTVCTRMCYLINILLFFFRIYSHVLSLSLIINHIDYYFSQCVMQSDSRVSQNIFMYSAVSCTRDNRDFQHYQNYVLVPSNN